jgi:talin
MLCNFQLSLRLAESFRSLTEDTQIAQNLMNSPELGQRMKSGVQRLGTVCIELVKLSGQRRNYQNDQVFFSCLFFMTKFFIQRVYQQLSQHSILAQERVREVLAILSEGSRGTQACINAAQTVSGIIGDLDTTIMFATSGSLNPPQTQPIGHQHAAIPGEFGGHRDVIIKTAKV